MSLFASSIFRNRFAGGMFQNVRRFADSTRLDVLGRFSRDGERIAFVSDRNGWARVWGRQPRRFGVELAVDWHARWALVEGARLEIDSARAC